MNGVTGVDFKRGFPRLPKELRRPKMRRHFEQQAAWRQQKHELEELTRRTTPVA